MKATLHILNGKPVTSVREKSELLNRLPEGHEENELIEIHEKYDQEQWESECLPINNPYEYWCITDEHRIEIKRFEGFVPFIAGQKAEIQITDNGCIVTKII